jgi:hypothetical protein
VRIAVQIADRAVERIEDPAPAALAPLAGALLGEQRVVRPPGGQEVPDQLLGVAVGVRDEVGGRGLRADPPSRPPEALQQQRTGLAGSPLGESEVVAPGQKIARSRSTTTTIAATTPTT